MEKLKNLNGGGICLDNSCVKLSSKQLSTLQKIGHGILITSNKDCVPRGSIVEPSYFLESEIIIPVVQLCTSFKNVKENKNIFLHFVKENKKDFGWSTQYKINAVAKIETKGEMFEKAKHFEETERLPEDMKVRAIIRAKIKKLEIVEG